MNTMWSEVKSLSLFAKVAYQAPPSMGFSRQEYWSGLPFPSPGDLSDPGIKPGSPSFQADALTSEPPGKPIVVNIMQITATCGQFCSLDFLELVLFFFSPEYFFYPKLIESAERNTQTPRADCTSIPLPCSIIFQALTTFNIAHHWLSVFSLQKNRSSQVGIFIYFLLLLLTGVSWVPTVVPST